VNEIKMKAIKKQETNWKSWIRKLARWRTKNGWRTVKNDGKPSRIRSRKHLESVTEVPRLGFSSRKQFFPLKTTEIHSQGGWGILRTTPFCLFIGKRGMRLLPSSPRRVGLLPPEAIQLRKTFWKAQFKIAICTPHFDKFTPFFCNLQKSYGSL